MTQGDVVGFGRQQAPDGGFQLGDPDNVLLQLRQELRRTDIGGQQAGLCLGQIGQSTYASLQLVGRIGDAFADRQRFHVGGKPLDEFAR